MLEFFFFFFCFLFYKEEECAWPGKRISVCLHSFTSTLCLNVISNTTMIQVKKATPQKNIFPGLVSKYLLSLG